MVPEQRQTETWVAKARQGDTVALAKLLTTLHPRLRARVEARLDPAWRGQLAPDDLLQEVYLEVFRQIGQFEYRGRGSFLAWVCAILDHTTIDAVRAVQRRARHLGPAALAGPRQPPDGSYWNLFDQLYVDTGTPSRVARRQEAVTVLRSCLRDLSDGHRQVIEWRYLQELPLADVAARLGKSEGAVVALTQRALRALRAAMDHRGDVTRGGWA
jgi:RNA polymerase sigma-70 factor (ECF subfamily)